MGRFSAGGARLHELRQPKPANAALHQSRPPRSRGSSLGPEHPQRTIRPACQEEPAFGRYRTASRAPSAAGAGAASASPNPPRRPRGAFPASSPWDPTGRMPAQAPRGCCPGRAARAARATSPQNSGRHRLVAGNSVGMPALAGLRESGAARRVPGVSADKPSKEALHRRPIGEPRQKPTALQGSAEALRRKQDSRRQIAASVPHTRGRACPKGPENGLGAGSCADASTGSAMRHRGGAAGKEAEMYANPKETTSLRLDATMKRRSRC